MAEGFGTVAARQGLNGVIIRRIGQTVAGLSAKWLEPPRPHP
ncbi:hypothetical protein [Streptomyces cucumeris]